MTTPSISSRTVIFGAFEVRMGTGELLKHGIRVRLQRQPFQILSALLARPGEVITRTQLHEQLWTDGTLVEFEHGLNSAINRLREVLGDDADAPKFIETLPRLGYRFIASVSAPPAPAQTAPTEPAPIPPDVGGHVRVNAQLLDARQDRHLWAANFERDMADVMDLQGELARAIATQVHAKVTPQEDASLAKKRPTNPEAYDALLTGRFLLNRRNEAAARKAVGYFQRAVELDSRNPTAWAALGECYASLGADLGVARSDDVLPATRSAIAKALELDPNLAEAHATLARIKLWYDWDWTGAEREYRRAIELNPNDSTTHRGYSHYLQVRKRFDEALAENKRAIDLAPLDILSSIHLAWLYADAHQGQKAVEQSQRVLEMDPAFTGAYLWLARGYELQGKWRDAIAAYEHARDAYRLAYVAGVAHILAASGDNTEAQAALARLTALSKQEYVSPMFFAEYYAGLGDRDAAMAWLEESYREHAPGLISLDVNYKWDPLRSDPRFQDLLRRVGFL